MKQEKKIPEKITNKWKKLLVVIPYFVPAYSYWWPIKVAYDFSIELIKKWYEVTVVTTDALDAKNRNTILEETIDWIKVIRFRNVSNYLAKFHNLYLPIWMRKWLKKNVKNYDIVHIHDILNIPALLWSYYARKNNVNYFIHPHGILSDTRIWSKKSWIKKTILKIFSYMLDDAKIIFALTKQEEKEVKQYTTNKNITILPNWIDLKEFEDIPEIDLRRKYWLDKDTIIFSFIWRIQYIKWLDIAFKLLSQYDKINSNWRYLVIWPDEWEKDKLIKLSEELWIEDKIIWWWQSTWKGKYSLLKASDVFLFTSRAEWFPMTILEALWCWLPVFISEWCNFPEVDGVVGKVVKNWVGENMDLLIGLVKDRIKFQKDLGMFLEKYSIFNIISKLDEQYSWKFN